jgi:hypothetical protein
LLGGVQLLQPQVEVGRLELPLGFFHASGKFVQKSRF